MTDVGGSCARRGSYLLSKLKAGGSDAAAALSEIRGSVRRLAFDRGGCRVVQLALEMASHQERAELVAELHGYVRRAITSPHANYVIQKIIEVMPLPLSSFIISELCGHGSEVSRHRYGCRIICRLVEHLGSYAKTVDLIEEILKDAGELCRH